MPNIDEFGALFATSHTIIAFIMVVASINLASFVEERFPALEAALLAVALAAGLYCLAAGSFLLVDWVDPLAAASEEKLAQASSKSGGKGGFIILLIKFWPYALVLFGAIGLYLGQDGVRGYLRRHTNKRAVR